MTAHPLLAQRDDGPLPPLIGRVLGGALRVPAGVLTVVGAVPLLVAAALVDDRAALWLIGLAVLWFVLLGSAPAGRPPTDRLNWLVPPLIRLTEYVALWRLVLLADPDAQAAAYLVLGVLAYHHYDTIYRQRQQRTDPPAWLESAGGGWALRLLAALLAAALGAPDTVVVVVVGMLALIYAVESVANWVGFSRARSTSGFDDEGG